MELSKTIAEKRDQLRRFVSVVAGCWAYILAGHHDEAVAALIAARPQAKLDPTVIRAQVESLKNFVYTDATRNLPFGTMAASDWKDAVAVLGDGGLVDKSLDPELLFTNDLLDSKLIADFAAGKF